MSDMSTQLCQQMWAIRIGQWPNSRPYFMGRDDDIAVPVLFATKSEAQAGCTERWHKPVRVVVATTGATHA